MIDNPDSVNYEPRHPLSMRVRLFVGQYLASNHDRIAAAKAAGFYGDEDTLKEVATELLARDNIALEIRKRYAMQILRLDITHARVINELAAIAFFDPADLFDSDGNYLPIHKMPENARRALSVVTSGVNVSGVKIFSKEKALEMIGKYLGMFRDAPINPAQIGNIPSVSDFDLATRANQLLESEREMAAIEDKSNDALA